MLKGMTRGHRESALVAAHVVVGFGLALIPWMLGYADDMAPAWNAWIVGVLVALLGIGALVFFNEWEAWGCLALGIWLLISPWALGFTALPHAVAAHVIAGAIVAILAAIELWFVHNRPLSAV